MISIKNLTKIYNNNTILNDLTLNIESGKIIGLLGPNGSGKTTLLKIITNITPFSMGKITINGEPKSFKTNKYISYLPDTPFCDTNLSIKNAISQFKYFYSDFDEQKAIKLLNTLKLNINQKIKTLSKGSIEKLHLILILSRNTKLYILDEPIAGVDIITRQEIMKLISENINKNSSAIITTHLISDIEQLFDQVAFLKNGKIDKIFDVEQLRYDYNKSVEDLYKEYFGGNSND